MFTNDRVERERLESRACRVSRRVSVLGGGAMITGGPGLVAIQAAFPTRDDSIVRDVYIVKAAAEEGSTDSWSVTAAAFCTPSTWTTKVFETSLFDSSAVKKVTVECPYPFKVVGMGGEVAKQDYEHPTNDPETIPIPTDEAGTGLVFQGFEVAAGLTKVTAYAGRRRGSPGARVRLHRRLEDRAFTTCASRRISAAWSGEACAPERRRI